MNIIEKAINFAASAHDGQKRKSTDIPYITHPFAVGMILQKANCSDELIAAGILHDTLEDTPVTYDDLVNNFGKKIANLVLAASEQDKSLPWEERKLHTIESLSNVEKDAIHVIVADKIHNLRSIRNEFETSGQEVWKKFNRGKNQQHWYYSGIIKKLLPRKNDCALIEELEKEVVYVFGSIDLSTTSKNDI